MIKEKVLLGVSSLKIIIQILFLKIYIKLMLKIKIMLKLTLHGCAENSLRYKNINFSLVPLRYSTKMLSTTYFNF